MSLNKKLQDNVKLALKNWDELSSSIIRLLLSSVSYARIGRSRELTGDEVCQSLLVRANFR